MTIYVSSNVEMSGDGSKNRPFATIQEAADIARPGDVVLVGDGIYREHVRPVHAGTAYAPIVYRAAKPRKAVITGAEAVSVWEPTGDRTAAGEAIWRAVLPNGVFGSYNPFATLLAGDWIQLQAPLHTAMLFIDDRPLQEVTKLREVGEPPAGPRSFEEEPPAGFWYAEQQGGATVITASFRGEDPAKHLVEVSARRSCFMPAENHVDYITAEGFVFTKAATQWAPPTAYQDGAVGPHWARGWVIRDCEVSFSRCAGISLGKYLQPENENKWTTKHVKHGTQTERDAVCQAVNEGWTKETIGSHTVRDCEIHDCGQAGIVGHLGCAFSLIENNHIHHINNRRDVSGAEIGGIKLHAAIDTLIARNHIHHCTRGLWLDWQAQGTRVSANFFHDNMPFGIEPEHPTFGEDLFIEVSHGPTIVDNNVLLSAHAAKLATQGVAFVHNLIGGAFTCVGRGTDNKGVRFPSPRYTPYHVPHGTAIAGFMTILHGDMRFYNNLFVQQYPLAEAGKEAGGAESAGTENGPELDERLVGTKPYDGYPSPEAYFAQFTDNESMTQDRDRFYDHLPVEAHGNVYLGGAQPYDGERDACVIPDSVVLALENGRDGWSLSTDLYRHVPANLCGMITSDTLGEAFEPEQRFEAPDGSAIIFRTDYHGRHRGVYPVCGPFEAGGEKFVKFPLTRRVAAGYLREDTGGSQASDKEAPPLPEEMKNSFAAAFDRMFADGEEAAPDEPQPVANANLVLVNCEACTFPLAGEAFTVREVYVRGNEVWMTSAEHPAEAVHLDCEYGYFKRLADPALHAPFSIDVTEDRNLLGIVNTLATLFRILTKSMVQDPQTVCERIREKANETLSPAGITMRFTPQLLKFIKNRKFITLEEVIDTVARPDQEVVAEVIVAS